MTCDVGVYALFAAVTVALRVDVQVNGIRPYLSPMTTADVCMDPCNEQDSAPEGTRKIKRWTVHSMPASVFDSSRTTA